MGLSVTVEKDKAEPGTHGATPAARTVVGVPAMPPDRPSDAAPTRELPARPSETDEDEQPTAIDMKAVSATDADRVLSGRPPGVAGALSPRPSGVAGKTTPPLAGDMFRGLPRPAAGRPAMPEAQTRSGVAPQPGIATRGRSTLLLDGSAPPSPPSDSSVDNPPIIVPASGAMAPKAVTQPPPWGEGAAHAAAGIPRFVPPMRSREPSVEEVSTSMLLPPDAPGAPLASAAEELSGSVLIEDTPGGHGPPIVTKAPAPGSWMSSSPVVRSPAPKLPHATRSPSVKPPVPQSPPAGAPAHTQRAPLGMPELPRATPGPDLGAIHAASAAHTPAAPPPPQVAPAFGPGMIPPPPAFDLPAPEPWYPAPPFATEALPTLVGGQAPQVRGHALPAAGPTLPSASFGLHGQPAGMPLPSAASPHAPFAGSPSGAPPAAPMTGDIELTRLPRSPTEQALDRARQTVRRLTVWLEAQHVLRPGVRPPWFLPAVAVAGLVVGIGLVGLLVSVVRGATRGDGGAADAGGGRASSSRAAHAPSAAPIALAPAPPAVSLPACTVTGAAHVIGPSATVAAGVEVTVSGGDIALGFAPGDHDAMAVRVDPAELSVGATARAHSRDTVRRATPILSKGALSLAVDTDRKGDKLQGRRTVRSTPPVQLGAADGQLSWTKLGASSPVPLWALAGPGIDAVRGSVDGFGDPTIAVAFRSGGAVWMGTIAGTGGLAPVGPLSHIDGLGTTIGSPAVAISSSVVLVAWADRASNDAPWKLRWARMSAGAAPDAPTDFAAPDGGEGGPYMSPALAPVPGGRFLLVWTEGPASGHRVRALTLGPDGSRVGAPLYLSPEGANAGQAQAAITAGGEGVVAFLESGGKGFELAAAPIHCGTP